MRFYKRYKASGGFLGGVWNSAALGRGFGLELSAEKTNKLYDLYFLISNDGTNYETVTFTDVCTRENWLEVDGSWNAGTLNITINGTEYTETTTITSAFVPTTVGVSINGTWTGVYGQVGYLDYFRVGTEEYRANHGWGTKLEEVNSVTFAPG